MKLGISHAFRVLFVSCAASIWTLGAVQAQNLEKFVMTGEAAKRALTKTEISADTAEKLAKACEAYATEHHFYATIFILSPAGSIVHAHRMDGQGPNNIETALYKAKTALATRRPTSSYEKEYATDTPAELARVKLDQYYVSGGLPIIVEDQLIGAIGVGGSRNGDEQCAHAALTKVLGPQPPLTFYPAPAAQTK